MGYAVYEDANARDWGVTRWAGYGVPASCDMPDCFERIDRGLGYKCERPSTYRYFADGEEVTADDDWDEEIEVVAEGCGLFFCEAHRYDHTAHADVEPKPDSAEWEHHLLTDESWTEWREKHAPLVAELRDRHAAR